MPFGSELADEVVAGCDELLGGLGVAFELSGLLPEGFVGVGGHAYTLLSNMACWTIWSASRASKSPSSPLVLLARWRSAAMS